LTVKTEETKEEKEKPYELPIEITGDPKFEGLVSSLNEEKEELDKLEKEHVEAI